MITAKMECEREEPAFMAVDPTVRFFSPLQYIDSQVFGAVNFKGGKDGIFLPFFHSLKIGVCFCFYLAMTVLMESTSQTTCGKKSKDKEKEGMWSHPQHIAQHK